MKHSMVEWHGRNGLLHAGGIHDLDPALHCNCSHPAELSSNGLGWRGVVIMYIR